MGPHELHRRQKLRYDLLYIRRQSFPLDLRLVLISFLVTFTGKWEDRSAKFPRLLGGRRSARRPIVPLEKPECEMTVGQS